MYKEHRLCAAFAEFASPAMAAEKAMNVPETVAKGFCETPGALNQKGWDIAQGGRNKADALSRELGGGLASANQFDPNGGIDRFVPSVSEISDAIPAAAGSGEGVWNGLGEMGKMGEESAPGAGAKSILGSVDTLTTV